MDDDELSALFKAYNKENVEKWERARLVAYHSVQWGKNPPTIQKFLSLPSDKANKNNPKTPKLTEEQRKSRAKGLASALNLT